MSVWRRLRPSTRQEAARPGRVIRCGVSAYGFETQRPCQIAGPAGHADLTARLEGIMVSGRERRELPDRSVDLSAASVPPYVAHPRGRRSVGLGRQRRRSKREAHVSDRRSALIGILSRRCGVNRSTGCTPGRVPYFGRCGGERQQAGRHRRKKRYAHGPHVFAL